MKINCAKSAGFCSGVKRAIDIALATAGSGRKVFMLGDIVHNEEVVRMIKNAGIKKISSLKKGRNHILLIRAHGTGVKTIERAKRLRYSIIDATCPMVKEIHRIVREAESKGYKIIVIGDKEHDEVRGIIGQLRRKGVVIESVERIPWKLLRPLRKVCVVSQSTQNTEKVTAIVTLLTQRIPEVVFHNTICGPTRIKQNEMKTMPKANDVMLVIGSRASANTRRLFELSCQFNKRSYWVSSKKEVNPDWFKGATRVGVTAGASTPQRTIEEIVDFLSRLP
jgi:4-hydroxy-3-methylbut-2-enyl diphosphate reductase